MTACEVCDGTGCPCLRMRDWQSMELGCECGCPSCGLDRHEAADSQDEPPIIDGQETLI